MTSDRSSVAGTESSTSTSNLVGLCSAVLTVLITVITFGLAITAITELGRGLPRRLRRVPLPEHSTRVSARLSLDAPCDASRRGLLDPRGIHPRLRGTAQEDIQPD